MLFASIKGTKAVCKPKHLKKFEDLVKRNWDFFRPDNQPKKKIKKTTKKKMNLRKNTKTNQSNATIRK
jgi:hypothetical protein